MLKLFSSIAALVLSVSAFGVELALLNAQIVDPLDGSVSAGHLILADVIITRTERGPTAQLAQTWTSSLDLRGHWVMPALVDMHVHLRGNRSPNGALQIMGLEGAGKALRRRHNRILGLI